MAGITAVLRAVARAQWRDLRSLGSITGNNFFLFVLLLLQEPKSAQFFIVMIGALILFPLSADPLRTVPRDRLALWPFSPAELVALRIGSLALSPVVWILTVLLLRTARLRPVLELALAAACIQAVLLVSRRWAARAPQWNVLRLVPAFPGAFGIVVRKDLRQILCTLDFYMAAVLAAVAAGYRVFATAPDTAALSILTLVVVLAFSTYAQCLFGLDGPAGITRYHLMPLRGWRILLAKDTAWLLLLAPLILALDPLTGFTAALVALAVGHHAAVRRPLPQLRWRFTSGLLPVGLIQVVAMFAAGTAVERVSRWYLTGAFACWLISLAGYGLLWDKTRE